MAKDGGTENQWSICWSEHNRFRNQVETEEKRNDKCDTAWSEVLTSPQLEKKDLTIENLRKIWVNRYIE